MLMVFLMRQVSEIDSKLLFCLAIEVSGVSVGFIGILALAYFGSIYQAVISLGGLLVSIGSLGFAKVYEGEPLDGQFRTSTQSETSIFGKNDVGKSVIYNGSEVGSVKQDNKKGIHIAITESDIIRHSGDNPPTITEEDGLTEDCVDIRDQQVLLKEWPPQEESEIV